MKQLWSGRFKESLDDLMLRFSASISYDQRLYAYDIEGSIAHCKTLKKAKVLNAVEAQKIIAGLKKIEQEFEKGKFQIDETLEDIHMNIERRLTERIGSLGGKLHTGRSRNDQIALDVRLYLRDEIGNIDRSLQQLGKVMLGLAEKYERQIIPGYTHLQRAQPILLAHHLLAYVEMFSRDRDRLEDVLKRVNVMPLGSAALAGTNFPLDRHYTARLLKFPKITNNSLDAVADRDFIAEFLSFSSLLMMHMSRLAEEVVLWASSEFGFLELSDRFTTGSSIMPQKKNPDAAELVRGKTGRVFGHLMGLLTVMKGLPLAYNKDMQEDKEPLFDTVDTVKTCLDVFSGMMDSAKFRPLTPEALAQSGFLTATDIADYLVMKNMPFRKAHEVTGQTVAHCLENGITLEQLTLPQLKKISKVFEKDVFEFISIENSVARKNVHGGTAGPQVKAQIRRLKREWVARGRRK
ncbi:MAG: argininosuccinate lyase [Candidatus Nitronauta litoralis]|uniref:Argininosuccinate lyase n=1 Tax=Candidatus Nitronauta litoralis TaxID=2705533 RepID=A0A7T0BV11_9BACT|nr:MAG: argininosuccinate lyase [Candidatus Nitronauta litoralis]